MPSMTKLRYRRRSMGSTSYETKGARDVIDLSSRSGPTTAVSIPPPTPSYILSRSATQNALLLVVRAISLSLSSIAI